MIFEPVPVRKMARVPIKYTSHQIHHIIQSSSSSSSHQQATTSLEEPQALNLSGKVNLSIDKSPFLKVFEGLLPFDPSPEPKHRLFDFLNVSQSSETGTISQTPTVEIHCKFVHRMRYIKVFLYPLFLTKKKSVKERQQWREKMVFWRSFVLFFFFSMKNSFTRDHTNLYELFGRAGIRLSSNPNKRSLAWWKHTRTDTRWVVSVYIPRSYSIIWTSPTLQPWVNM